MSETRPLTIGGVAKLAGVSPTTVRFYERAGVVRPVSRTAANYRLYPPDAVARIRFTRRAQELGFTLREVKELLTLRTDGARSCERVRETATTKIADIQDRIRSLQRMGRALARLAEECKTHKPGSGCPLLEYLENRL
ncbi:MAG: heavy metal-responsive transcriptional regulator [Verrucomicrobia subdivision 3 bacterium]|nr:heavy metal-responsive transcriptional regulator [Limisphaerales bacterium]